METKVHVKNLRKEKGWSQETLSELSGLNVRTIQRIEKGEKASVESLKALAAVYEVDFSTLQSGDENQVDAADLETAKQRVKLIKDFYIHIAFYVVTSIFLFLLNFGLSPGIWWFHFPVLIWVVALVLHSLMAYDVFGLVGKGWEERQLSKHIKDKVD